MRAHVVLPALVLLTAAASAQERDDGYIEDYDDIGGVIVYRDPTPPQQPGFAQPEPIYTEPEDTGGPYTYYGPHPDGQGGWDPTEGLHVHDAPPFDPYLFTQENGAYYFIGDPIDFGYAGNDVYGYYGPHPIALVYGGGTCYYTGYHRHRFAPAGRFLLNNGWAVWNGPMSPWYGRFRDRYDHYFHDVYPRHFANGPSGPHIRFRNPGARGYVPPVQRIYAPTRTSRTGITVVPHPGPVPKYRPPATGTPIIRDHRR